MTDQKIQNRELAGYFPYAVGQCLSFGLVGSFILYFTPISLEYRPLRPGPFSSSPVFGMPSTIPDRRLHGHAEFQGGANLPSTCCSCPS